MPRGGTGARWRAPLDNAVADGSCAASDVDRTIAAATLAVYANAWPAADALAAAQRAVDALEADDPPRAYFALYLVFNLYRRTPEPFDRARLLERMRLLEQPGWNDLIERLLRTARGDDRQSAGDTARYLQFCRDEIRLCARSGAAAGGWTAAQGLHDSGAVDAALAVGRAALAEIRAAGPIRQNVNFLALWVTMQVEQGAHAESRRAVLAALPVLRGAGTPWMLHLAMAGLMLNEGRSADAAQLLGPTAAARGTNGHTSAQLA